MIAVTTKLLRHALPAMLLLFVLEGCGSVEITSSWKNPELATPAFKKIMVVALTGKEDISIRPELENQMADELCALGYDAVSAYTTYGPDAFQTTDEETVLRQMYNDQIDAVLTIVLLNKENSRSYYPTYVNYSADNADFWGYHSATYQRLNQPEYYAENMLYYWESNLYDMPTQHLLYSVQTKSNDYHTSSDVAHQYGRAIVTNMLRKKLLTKSDQ
jgi:hypothetical protein